MKFVDMASTDQGPVLVHLIGISGYARQILGSLQHVIGPAGGRIASATVINRQEEEATCRLLESSGCRVYPDYKSMLGGIGPGRNLCIVPTSIYQHAPMTIDALRAGADVLVEKPLAGSVQDAREMVQAGRLNGRSVSVGFQDMYAPQVWEIKQALADGVIGAVRSIRITASWPRNADYYRRNRWAGREFCDGRPVFDSPLSNAFAHFLNLALFFAAGDRDETASATSVSGRLFRFFPIETFDTAQVVYRTLGGVEIECLLTHAAAERLEPNIEIEGEQGTLSWHQEDYATLRDPQGNTLRKWKLDTEETNRQRMLTRVLEDTRAGNPPACSASMALHHVEAVHLAVRELAIEDGREIFNLDPRDSSALWIPTEGLLPRLIEEYFAVSQ